MTRRCRQLPVAVPTFWVMIASALPLLQSLRSTMAWTMAVSGGLSRVSPSVHGSLGVICQSAITSGIKGRLSGRLMSSKGAALPLASPRKRTVMAPV